MCLKKVTYLLRSCLGLWNWRSSIDRLLRPLFARETVLQEIRSHLEDRKCTLLLLVGYVTLEYEIDARISVDVQ